MLSDIDGVSRWETSPEGESFNADGIGTVFYQGVQTLNFVFQPFDCIQLNRNGLQIMEIF